MDLPDRDTRATRAVDEEARWLAYQAWLRQHGNGLTEPAAAPAAPDEDGATPPPSFIGPAMTKETPRAASRPRRRAGLIAAVALGAVVIAGLGVLVKNTSGLRGGTVAAYPAPSSPASGELKVQADTSVAATKLKGPQPLPCFVAGRPAGAMTLDACARRNGVASGKLDVGIDQAPPPAQAFAAPAPRRAPPRPDLPPAVQTAEAPTLVPPPPSAVAITDPQATVRTVRRFYRALAEDDAYSATALLTPERRGEGAFATARLGQSDGSGPLRVTEIDPLGPSSVLVRYEVPDAEGDVCVGSAHVETVLRGDETLVRSVHTVGGC